MPEFRQKNASVWISKLPETAFNTFYTVGSDYMKARMSSPVVIVPRMEKENDAGQAGNGHEFATFVCNRYWLPISLGLDDTCNFDLAGRLLLRALSGVVTDTTVTGGVFKHACNMLPIAAGLQMKPFDVISELGGASFLCAGGVVERFRLFQDAAAPPRFQTDIISSGKHRSPHLIGVQQVETATAVGTITLTGTATVIVTAANMPSSPRTLNVNVTNADTPSQWADKVRIALAADPIINGFFLVSGASASIVLTARHTAPNDTAMNISLANGTCTGITAAPTSADTTAGSYTLPTTPSIIQCPKSKVEVKWTDSGGLRDFATGACTLRSWFCDVANNHAPTDDRCATDPEQKEGDPTLTTGPGVASFLSKLTHGDRVASAQIVVLLDSILPDWIKYAQNEALTDVTFTVVGPDVVAGFPAKLTMIIPQARIESVDEIDSNGKAALQLNILPIFDSASGGVLKAEVINGLDGASPDYN